MITPTHGFLRAIDYLRTAVTERCKSGSGG